MLEIAQIQVISSSSELSIGSLKLNLYMEAKIGVGIRTI